MVHLERAQVPLVHPDDLGAGLNGPVQFEPVVDLHQGGQRAASGQFEERAQLGIGQGGHDQQHGIGPHQAGVAPRRGLDREVLAKDGEGAGPPGHAAGPRSLPPKNSASVSTDRQVAPPASYSLATVTGSSSGSSAPLDGERRLISAMTAIPWLAAPSTMAPLKDRTGRQAAACSRSSSRPRRSHAAAVR